MNQTLVIAGKNYRKQWMMGIAVFFIAVIAGLFWAKWHPYFLKASLWQRPIIL